MWISSYLGQSKYTKIHYHEIPFIGLNVLEFFCVPLYTEFLSNLYQKFQIAYVYDTNVESQIWCFCYNLFLSTTLSLSKHCRNRYTFLLHAQSHHGKGYCRAKYTSTNYQRYRCKTLTPFNIHHNLVVFAANCLCFYGSWMK